jgi:hypothetical protein
MRTVLLGLDFVLDVLLLVSQCATGILLVVMAVVFTAVSIGRAVLWCYSLAGRSKMRCVSALHTVAKTAITNSIEIE